MAATRRTLSVAQIKVQTFFQIVLIIGVFGALWCALGMGEAILSIGRGGGSLDTGWRDDEPKPDPVEGR
jgi:hypothetical protein